MALCLWSELRVGGEGGFPGALRGKRGRLLCLLLPSLLPHLLLAQCEMSEWSPWGPCSKKRKLCGFRKGLEERTRRVLHAPGGDHTTCSDTKETRKCTVRRTPCPEGKLQPLHPGDQLHPCPMLYKLRAYPG